MPETTRVQLHLQPAVDGEAVVRRRRGVQVRPAGRTRRPRSGCPRRPTTTPARRPATGPSSHARGVGRAAGDRAGGFGRSPTEAVTGPPADHCDHPAGSPAVLVVEPLLRDSVARAPSAGPTRRLSKPTASAPAPDGRANPTFPLPVMARVGGRDGRGRVRVHSPAGTEVLVRVAAVQERLELVPLGPDA